MWQDTVIAVCQLAFVPALIPAVLGPDKPPLSTCILNVVIVTVLTATMATLHLWLATTTGALVALTWVILSVQKFLIDRSSAVSRRQVP